MSNPGRGANYSNEEVEFLLSCVRSRLPIGPEEWKLVENDHKEKFPEVERSYGSLRKKFNSYANAKIQTGNPHCPPEVREAKRIVELIKDDADIITFNNASNDLNEHIEAAAPRNEATSPTVSEDTENETVVNPPDNNTVRGANTTTLTSTPTVPSGTSGNHVITPRLQRVSVVRKKNHDDGFSIQEFFKYTMAQREEDRKERIEREREERERRNEEREKREADDRMFKNMFMAVLLQGQNKNNGNNQSSTDDN